jgi:hypothetical protein
MYSQSHLLNRALLEIRSSFIISHTFILRWWFALGSVCCILSIFGFWTFTLAPIPSSTQVHAWCQLARFKAPVTQQLAHDYIQAVQKKNFRTAQHLKEIGTLLKHGTPTAAHIYLAGKAQERSVIESSLTQRMWRHGYVALAAFFLSPVCFILGFMALRRYLRCVGYSFQGRLLFFRIATPSVFKLGALIVWGYLCFLSYQMWSPSAWESAHFTLPIAQDPFLQNFSLLTQEKLWHLELQSVKEILKGYWIQSAVFYTFFGAVLWLLGRRWSQLPCREV